MSFDGEEWKRAGISLLVEPAEKVRALTVRVYIDAEGWEDEEVSLVDDVNFRIEDTLRDGSYLEGVRDVASALRSLADRIDKVVAIRVGRGTEPIVGDELTKLCRELGISY